MCDSVLDTDMVIIYLSAGITSKDSSEDDKKATLRVINEENSFLNNSVMILTYALMNGERRRWFPDHEIPLPATAQLVY